MIKEEYKYSELTSKIIGCAMTVHSELGGKEKADFGSELLDKLFKDHTTNRNCLNNDFFD
jgi:hypothetical protein